MDIFINFNMMLPSFIKENEVALRHADATVAAFGNYSNYWNKLSDVRNQFTSQF